MLLGEPERTQGDLNFSLFGIPVRVHPFFWLIALLLGAQSTASRELSAVVVLLIWVVALFVSILVHEMGHAFAYRTYGLRPRVTLYGLGGLASADEGFAVRSRASSTMGRILISLAGPGAGFSLAALIILAIVFAGPPVGFFPNSFDSFIDWLILKIHTPTLRLLAFQFLMINIIWGLINLMPVYPLDGGQISRELFLRFNPHDGIRQSLILSIITAGGLALFGIAIWQQYFMAILFGYLAVSSYMTLQAYSGRRPW